MMSLKSKILLLALLPLIVVTVAITWISQKQAHQLSEEEIATFEKNLMASKKQQLKDYVELAVTSISEPLQTLNWRNDPRLVQDEVRRILNGLTYGEDGYFFVYDKRGVNLVHPLQPELVGRNLIELQDSNGKYVIQELLQLAEQGGGFSRYRWKRPSGGMQEDKLSYVVSIPEFQWMMGTGLYVDEIAQEVEQARNQVEKNIRKTFFTVLIILSGTSILIIAFGVAINLHGTQLADKRLKELAHRSVHFQVIQRRNFARELHDGINQLMISAKLRLNLASKKKQQQEREDNLKKAGELLDLAIQEVRRVSHDLRPILLDDLGFDAAVQNMLDDIKEQTHVAIDADIDLPIERLPDAIEMTLYRIIQEALTNVQKHADAKTLRLIIWHDEDAIYLQLEDDGKGFTLSPDIDGIGLLNMRERTELLGGQFSIQSRPKQGTKIKVKLFITASKR